MSDWQTDICKKISEATGDPFELSRGLSQSGGCINEAAQWEGRDGRTFFVKVNRRMGVSLFEEEARGLSVIGASSTIRVPAVICWGVAADEMPFLVLEAITMGGRGKGAEMGKKVAAMHRVTGECFGWESDNYIGAMVQRNSCKQDWVEFYRDCRLKPQLAAAHQRGLKIPEAEDLLARLGSFFPDYVPEPSLLHGDLWGGNASFTQSGEPVVFDPAAYYGDRETDIAFTYMFGGFDSDFYGAYHAAYPLDVGFAQRKSLYNLYHELNHFNLFGGGYGTQARGTIFQLLRQV